MRDRLILAELALHAWQLHAPVMRDLASILERHAGGAHAPPAPRGAQAREPGRLRRLAERRGPATPAADDGDGRDEPAAWPAQAPAEEEGRTVRASVRGSVAVIPVSGVVAKYAYLVNDVSQPRGVVTADIAQALDEAAADERARSALLLIDSPGGTVAGTSQVLEAAARFRASGKPLVAYASDMAASGGYRIACAAEAIYANADAVVGSVGVCRAIVDMSDAAAAEGVRVHVLASGQEKAIGLFPGAGVSEDQLRAAARDVEAMASVFLAEVASARGLEGAALDAVARGGIFVGREAADAGLVDGVTGLDALLEAMDRMAGPAGDAAGPQARRDA